MALRLEDLTADVDGPFGVDVPALTAGAGEVLSLVGRGDAGQSRVLRLIGNLEQPRRGTVTLDGGVLGSSGPVNRNLAYLVLPRMASLLNRLASDDTPPAPLVLVDGAAQREADNGNGQADREATRRSLRRLGRRGVVVVYATQSPDEALEMSDQVGVLREGRLLQVGAPADLFARPANTFVATVFGDPPMNIVRAILEKDGCAVQVGPRSLQLSGEITETFCRDVYVGVRPTCLRLRVDPPTGWPGEVVAVSSHGGQTCVDVAVDGAKLLAVCPADASPSPGDRVGILLDPSDLFVFDDRGNRLEVR